MDKKKRIRGAVSVSVFAVVVGVALWATFFAPALSPVSDSSESGIEDPEGRVGSVADDSSPVGRGEQEELPSHRVLETEKDHRLSLRRLENRRLVGDLSLRYEAKPRFSGPPPPFEQLERILSLNNGRLAAEVEWGRYSLPLPRRKWFLRLDDEFEYLVGRDSVSRLELKHTSTVRFVRAGSSCRGRVVNPVGIPVPGAIVAAMVFVTDRDGMFGRLVGARFRFARTNANGDYVLRGLTADTKLSITVGAVGLVPVRRSMPPTRAYTTYWMPGTVLAKGARLDVEVLERHLRRPIAGATVTARPGPGVVWMDTTALTARTAVNGMADLTNLAFGKYEVMVQANGMQLRSGVFYVEKATGNTMSFELDPGRRLEGSVISDHDGKPIVGASVSAHCGNNDFPVWPRNKLLTDARGRFAIDSMPDGKLRLTVAARGYLSSVQELPEATSSIEVRLRREVSIFVRPERADGEPPAAYRLRIDRAGKRPGYSNVQQFGPYHRVDDLVPGEVIAVSVDTDEVYGQVKGIIVEAGKVVVVPVRGKTVVRGHVVDKNGRGVPEVEVHRMENVAMLERALATFGILSKKGTVLTADDGRFSIRLASGQTHRLGFSLDGYKAVSHTVLAKPGVNLTVEIERLPQISGKVLDRQGRPVAGANVLVVPQGDMPFPRHFTEGRKDGSFRLSVSSKTKKYVIRVTGRRRSGATWSVVLETDAAEGLIIRKPETSSRARGIVRGLRPSGSARLLATLLDGVGTTRDSTRARTSTRISSDGKFSLSHLMRGQYALAVIKNGCTIGEADMSVTGTGVDGITLKVKDQ